MTNSCCCPVILHQTSAFFVLQHSNAILIKYFKSLTPGQDKQLEKSKSDCRVRTCELTVLKEILSEKQPKSGSHFKTHLLSGGFLKNHSSSEAGLIGYHLFESDGVELCTSLICKRILVGCEEKFVIR